MASVTRRLWPERMTLNFMSVAAVAAVGDNAGERRTDLRLDLG
jgi:hypothetical protein